MERNENLLFENRRLLGITLVIAVLLMVPLVAMQFSNEVNWRLTDFVIMGVLLLSTGLTCKLVMRKVNKTSTRLILCGIVFILLFLIWAELAVGVFGTPFA